MENWVYHCSPVAGIEVLEPSVTKYFGKPQQVCLTRLLPMALFYGVCHFEYAYGYTREKQIYYQEYFPDALEKIYRGKSASLYRCALREDMEETAIPNELVTSAPVLVVEEIIIPDVYEALLQQERLGALKIVRWEQMPEKTLDWVLQAERDIILEKGLLTQDTPFARYMRETYPASWELALQQCNKEKKQ